MKSLWLRLTKPAAAILDSEQRRKAQLLSSLLLSLVILGTFSFLSSMIADYQSHSPGHSTYFLVGSLSVGLLGVLYFLSRTGRYKLSAGLTIIVIYLSILAIGWSFFGALVGILDYLILGVLLCSMLFSLRATIFYSVVCIAGTLLLPLFLPVPHYLDVFYPMIFVAMMTTLIAVAVRQRDLIETDRRAAQKKVEDALRDSEGRLRSLITSISDLVFAVDLDGCFLFYHAPAVAAQNISSISQSEFVGSHIRDRMPSTFAELLEQVIQQVTKSLSTQLLDYSIEIDGEVWYFSAHISPLFADEANLLGVTVVSRDVTEAVQARRRQQRLLELDELNRAITTSFFQSDTPDVVINDALRQIGEFMDVTRILIFQPREDTYLADCTYEWHSLSVEPLIDQLQGVPAIEELPSLIPMLIRDGIISVSHVSELPPDLEGMLAPHGVQSALILPFQTNDIRYGTITLEENKSARQWLPEEISTMRTIAEHLARVMEQRRSQLALIQARDAALRSARLKSEFMANMSHEVRTPMTGLLGMLELLRETNLEGDQREFADTAFESAHNLLNILDDILDFSKIEAGRVVLEARPIDLWSIVGGVKDTFSVQASKKQIGFETHIDPDAPVRVYCDPTRLRQILTNLASNAIKFTSHGSVSIRVRQVTSAQGRTRLRFEVQDTGIGISAEQQGHIFESFVQADGTTTRRYGGTALGLAICKQLVQLMGGEIDVKSEVGQGSTIGFTLSLLVAEDGQDETPSPQIDKLRVLVVDDQASSRHVLVQQLRLWGASVRELANPDELLSSLFLALNSGEPINVVISHSIEPAEKQIRLTTAIRESLKDNVPWLVRLEAPEGLLSGAADGFDSHLRYPLNHSELYDLLLERQEASPEKQVVLKPIYVLVADDNKINQQIVSKALELENINVDIAGNGEEALSFFSKNRYDLVLMDVHMPLIDGLEATRIIRAMDGELGQVPIIALTASILPDETQRYLEAGMSAVLGKPFAVDQLRIEIHKWLTSDTSTEQRTS
jgi:PAS domain S-box-containing protein